MTNIEKLHAMSLDEFSLWLDENGLFDNSPWMNWFDKEYCQNCEAEKIMMSLCMHWVMEKKRIE